MTQLASLPAFQTAQCVKVNPDTPQKQVRFLTLDGMLTLINSLRFCFLSVALTMYSELQPFQLEVPIIFASFQ